MYRSGRERVIYLDRETQIRDRVAAGVSFLKAHKIRPGQWYPYNGELREVVGAQFSRKTGKVFVVLSSAERLVEHVDVYEFVADPVASAFLPKTKVRKDNGIPKVPRRWGRAA